MTIGKGDRPSIQVPVANVKLLQDVCEYCNQLFHKKKKIDSIN